MNQEFIQKLKILRSIEPDAAFIKKSRDLILATKVSKPTIFTWPRLAWAGAFAIFALVLITSIFIPKQIITSSSNNEDKLSQEFNNLAINIQLNEIKYQQNINQAIASALTEITETDVRHLNQNLLEQENNEFNLPNTKDSEIDQLLDSVIF